MEVHLPAWLPSCPVLPPWESVIPGGGTNLENNKWMSPTSQAPDARIKADADTDSTIAEGCVAKSTLYRHGNACNAVEERTSRTVSGCVLLLKRPPDTRISEDIGTDSVIPEGWLPKSTTVGCPSPSHAEMHISVSATACNHKFAIVSRAWEVDVQVVALTHFSTRQTSPRHYGSWAAPQRVLWDVSYLRAGCKQMFPRHDSGTASWCF